MHLEQVLRDYPHLVSFINNHARRVENAQFRANTMGYGQDMIIGTIASERRLTVMAEEYAAIKHELEQSDEITKWIIKKTYFDNHMTQDAIGYSVHLKHSQVANIKNEFLVRVADNLGWE